VGTPGRIMDHLDKRTLDLSELKYLVLDEADEMLKMGFAEDVETILADTPDDKQVALFSATMPAAIRRMSKQYLHDPEEITVKTKTQTSANITQRYLVVSYQQKIDALTRILEVENFEGMIVFVRTKSVTEELAEKLRARGYSAAAINGDIAQVQRERTVNQLKSGKLDILVATDVAARGLDVERISHVVNFDIPSDSEPYVHRIGRTGRAGRTGDAISFVTPRERGLLTRIEKATKQPITQMQLPSVDDVNVTRLARFDDRISAALGQAERIDGFRDIIAHYVRNHDVPEADGAAAPQAVSSEISLIQSGFYDGTSCHRLTRDNIWVLQCGDPAGDGTGGPGYSYGPVENAPADGVYPAGTIAMARQQQNGYSQGSQFFIVYEDTTLTPDEAGGYTVVGRVTSGLDQLKAGVTDAGTADGGSDGAPAVPVTITGFTIE
uniref:helicase-related protein n=1 Tax=Agromyces humi TaxID=1766800 RepID=UPI0013582A60